ncbi:VQ-like protein [Artemisia annua]|uniref:VQ-like protein n=1 Tax=Artemisia annua TaxID=35608 RepID=A0A2U1L6Y0_ARTAN|nr:VQ-like protein [Artemisia annua]PWA51318.1 VQ-like protein [Artemisia annua]
MENNTNNYSPRPHDTKNPSPNTSTTSNTSTTHHSSPPPTPITRSDPNNPYPTTFVQADTSSFKKVVQMLTGSQETIKQARSDTPRNPNPIPPMKTNPNKKPSKLYERRNSMKNFKISPLVPGFVNGLSGSPRRPNTPEILSPGILNFPSLVLSPVTPLDMFNRSPVTGDSPSLNVEAEEKAIAKKGFYLHPSPATTPRRESEQPRLLPLFPVTSPRVSGSS